MSPIAEGRGGSEVTALLLSFFLFHIFISGGSLAKVAYMSEVRYIRKRHYSFTSLNKSDDEDHEKGV